MNKENPKFEEEMEEEIENPGDCIGHYLEDDENCKICEIQDSCKEMTKDLEDNPNNEKE